MEYDIRKNATQYDVIRFSDVSDIERAIDEQEAVVLQKWCKNEVAISSTRLDYNLVINSSKTAYDLITALQHAISQGWFGDKVMLNEQYTIQPNIRTTGI